MASWDIGMASAMRTSLALTRCRPWVVPLVLLALLEGWSRTTGAASNALAPPTRVLSSFVEIVRNGTLAHETAFTLGCALAGLAIGMATGVLAGTLLGLSHLASRCTFLTIEVLRPVPAVALIPLAMMIFGYGWSLEIAVVAVAVFWPILLLSKAAAQQVDAGLLEVAVALEMGQVARFVKIILPAMVPRLFTALRLGTAIAMVIVISVEVTANPRGIGYAMTVAQQSMDPARMLAWLFWFGALGIAIGLATQRLQSWAFARMGGVR